MDGWMDGWMDAIEMWTELSEDRLVSAGRVENKTRSKGR